MVTAQLKTGVLTARLVIGEGLFFFLSFGHTDGNIGVTPFFFEAATEVIVAAVHRAGTAFAGHEVVPVLGFNFITAEIAADCIFDNHWLSSLSNSFIRCAPYCTPSRKALCS